jgi:hypothetical protein
MPVKPKDKKNDVDSILNTKREKQIDSLKKELTKRIPNFKKKGK